MTPAGVLTTLASFDRCQWGQSTLALGACQRRQLYGTTTWGGAYDDGVVFRLIAPPQAAAPVFSPAAGTYQSVQAVQISSGNKQRHDRYTTDGSTPTQTNGTLYTGTPVSISSTTTLKASLTKPGLCR